MAESEKHISLVRCLYNWVKDELFDGDSGAIFIDLPESKPHCKPSLLVAGVRPDLYAKRTRDNLLIIGEAKTPSDLETKHSIGQYKSFLNECENHKGPSLIIMAVPWDFQRAAQNLLASLVGKNQERVEIKVLEKLPG